MKKNPTSFITVTVCNKHPQNLVAYCNEHSFSPEPMIGLNGSTMWSRSWCGLLMCSAVGWLASSGHLGWPFARKFWLDELETLLTILSILRGQSRHAIMVKAQVQETKWKQERLLDTWLRTSTVSFLLCSHKAIQMQRGG